MDASLLQLVLGTANPVLIAVVIAVSVVNMALTAWLHARMPAVPSSQHPVIDVLKAAVASMTPATLAKDIAQLKAILDAFPVPKG